MPTEPGGGSCVCAVALAAGTRSPAASRMEMRERLIMIRRPYDTDWVIVPVYVPDTCVGSSVAAMVGFQWAALLPEPTVKTTEAAPTVAESGNVGVANVPLLFGPLAPTASRVTAPAAYVIAAARTVWFGPGEAPVVKS